MGEARSWDTAIAPAGRKIPYWSQAICEAVLELDLEVRQQDPFEARMFQRDLGPMRMSRIIVSVDQTVHRTRSLIARSAKAQLEFITMRKGRALVTQHGHELLVAAGESVLIDGREPYDISLFGETENSAFHIPVGWLSQWLPNIESCVARLVNDRTPWGAALAAAIHAVYDARPDWPESGRLEADQIAGALALALGPTPESVTPHAHRLFVRLRQFLADNAHDCDLDAERAADELNISLRYLHSICAKAQTTYGAELMGVRLERAARLLRDPRFGDLSAAQIAWRCGFIDPSHFSKRFRERFHQPPGSFRSPAN